MPIGLGGRPADWDESAVDRAKRDAWKFVTSAWAIPVWAVAAALSADVSSAIFPAPKSVWATKHLVPALSALAIPVVVASISFTVIWFMSPYRQRNEARRLRNTFNDQLFPQKPPDPAETVAHINVLILAGTALADSIPDEMTPLERHTKVTEVHTTWVLQIDRTLGRVSSILRSRVLRPQIWGQDLSEDELRTWIVEVTDRLKETIGDGTLRA